MNKLLFALLFFPSIVISQNKLSGTFSPAKDYPYVFLYHSTPAGGNYVNRAQLDSISGKFEMTLDSTYVPGIYKMVYALPAENNFFEIIYDGKESINFNFSRDKGIEFTESLENKLLNSYLKSMTMVNETINNYYTKDGKNKDDFNAVFKTLKDTQASYEEATKDKLVSAFIYANKPYIPDSYEDIETYSKNLKSNYLTTIDFNNDLIKSSIFMLNRVNDYVFNIKDHPLNETYQQLVGDVANIIKDNDKSLQSYIMQALWINFAQLDNSEMANFITEMYLLDMSKAVNDEKTIKMITAYRDTSVGKKAIDFNIVYKNANSEEIKTSLHELKGYKNYLVIFWSSTCGHCLNQLPKVKQMVANKPDLKVIAFGLEDNDTSWSKEIIKYPEFINHIGLQKWENPIVDTYGIQGTPTYYLLSEGKIIMSKPILIEDLKVVIDSL